MTRDELYDVAEKVGLGFIRRASDKDVNKFEQLAALVASAEREACAKVCEDLDAWNMDDPASTAAKAIRARGQA